MSSEPALVYPATAVWVLVKGYHDSGSIDGVYGPFTKNQVDYLQSLCDGGVNNWTAMELKQWPDRFG